GTGDPDDVLGVVSEDAGERRGDGEERAVFGAHGEEVASLLHQGAEPPLAALDFVACRLLFGDVAAGDDGEGDASVVVEDWRGPNLEPDGPVGAHDLEVVDRHRPASEHLPPELLDRIRDVRAGHAGPVVPSQTVEGDVVVDALADQTDGFG